MIGVFEIKKKGFYVAAIWVIIIISNMLYCMSRRYTRYLFYKRGEIAVFTPTFEKFISTNIWTISIAIKTLKFYFYTKNEQYICHML